MPDDGNDDKISLFSLDIVLAHSQVSAFELSFHGVSVIKGCSLYQGVSYIGVLFAGCFFFFFSFFRWIPPYTGMLVTGTIYLVMLLKPVPLNFLNVNSNPF